MRNLPHSDSPRYLEEFINTLVRLDGQETVDSLEGYARYLLAGDDAMTADPGPEAKLSFLDRIKAFFQKIIDFIKKLFKK